jgi:transcriptional regulator with GAF, ATPase, and Fis domain
MGRVGREKVVANAIHLQSPRKSRPFVKVNCAALPETLLESETSAMKRSLHRSFEAAEGKVEMADGGTLFLMR